VTKLTPGRARVVQVDAVEYLVDQVAVLVDLRPDAERVGPLRPPVTVVEALLSRKTKLSLPEPSAIVRFSKVL